MTAEEHLVVRLLRERAATDSVDRAWLTTDAVALGAGETLAEVRRLASGLTKNGLTQGEVVLLSAERSVELVTSLLAIWMCGAIPALIDRSHPEAHRKRAVDAVGAGWVVTATAGDIKVHQLDPPRTRLTIPAVTSHILFTSGTTGAPAAVAVSQAPLAAMVDWYRNTVEPAPTDRFALLGGIGHDPLLRDIIASLDAGAQLIMPDQSVLTVPGALDEFLFRNRVTIAHVTPALLEFGLGQSGRALSDLRVVLSGGAALLRELAGKVVKHAPGAVLFNVYGTTETPQVVCAHRVGSDDLQDDASHVIPIGTGVAGAHVALAHELGLDGDPAEIVVASRMLALGYIGERPRSGFVEAAEAPKRTLYRTGDIGRRDKHGRLVVVGRRDRQVSINGYRVALEEIEHTAVGHPDVAHARAASRSGPFGTTLALTVALRPGQDLTAKDLRAFLRRELPSYVVPAAITIGEAKLDHNHKTLSTSVAGAGAPLAEGAR